MRALLIVLTIADLALLVLLIAVSGFILQGVNNTGPMLPESIFYVALMVACIVAPLAAWMLRGRISEGRALLIAALPLLAAGLALVIQPPA